jgi:hypothetical protein
MSDPMADMMLEAEQEAAAEREERTILLQRLTELRGMIEALAKAVSELAQMERAKHKTNSSAPSFTIDERDEHGQIKRFTLNS